MGFGGYFYNIHIYIHMSYEFGGYDFIHLKILFLPSQF